MRVEVRTQPAVRRKGISMGCRRWIGWMVAGYLLLVVGAAAPAWGQTSADEAGQSVAADTDDQPDAEDNGEAGASGAAAEDGLEDAEEAPQRGVLTQFQRMLRTDQSHLTEDGGSAFGIVPIITALVLIYIAIVLAVLTFWRRAKDPKFWRLRTEPMQGEGRWLVHLAYDIRRKVDTTVVLQMAKVDPPGCGAQLAYLVDGEIKGRIGEDGEAELSFKGLNPKNFWQGQQPSSLAIGFELIQPRDRKITLHLDIRSDFRIGKKTGLGGLFQELLVFEPVNKSQTLDVLNDDSTMGFQASGGEATLGGFSTAPGGLDDTGGFGGALPAIQPGMVAPALPGTAPGHSLVGGGPEVDTLRRQQTDLERRLDLLEGRFLSDGQTAGVDDDIAHRLRVLETKLDAMPNLTQTAGGLPELEQRLDGLQAQMATVAVQPSAASADAERRLEELQVQLASLSSQVGAPNPEVEQRLQRLEIQAGGQGTNAEDVQALRKEIRAAEERAAKALRENLQVVVKNMKGLRGELTQLNTAVNDMMQRFVNSERRMADIARRLPPES